MRKLLKERASNLTLDIPSVSKMQLHVIGTIRYPKQGIYFVFNENKELIYIGETQNFSDRLYAHAHTHKGFQQEALYVAFLPKSNSKVELKLLEALYINQYQPKYNVGIHVVHMYKEPVKKEFEYSVEERLKTAEETSIFNNGGLWNQKNKNQYIIVKNAE